METIKKLISNNYANLFVGLVLGGLAGMYGYKYYLAQQAKAGSAAPNAATADTTVPSGDVSTVFPLNMQANQPTA